MDQVEIKYFLDSRTPACMVLNIVWGPPASRAQVVRFHSTLTHGEAMLTDDGGVGSDSHAWKYWGEAVRPGMGGARGQSWHQHASKL